MSKFDPFLGRIETEESETKAILAWLSVPSGTLMFVVSRGNLWSRLISGEPTPKLLIDTLQNEHWQDSMQSYLGWNAEEKAELIPKMIKAVEELEDSNGSQTKIQP